MQGGRNLLDDAVGRITKDELDPVAGAGERDLSACSDADLEAIARGGNTAPYVSQHMTEAQLLSQLKVKRKAYGGHLNGILKGQVPQHVLESADAIRAHLLLQRRRRERDGSGGGGGGSPEADAVAALSPPPLQQQQQRAAWSAHAPHAQGGGAAAERLGQPHKPSLEEKARRLPGQPLQGLQIRRTGHVQPFEAPIVGAKKKLAVQPAQQQQQQQQPRQQPHLPQPHPQQHPQQQPQQHAGGGVRRVALADPYGHMKGADGEMRFDRLRAPPLPAAAAPSAKPFISFNTGGTV